MAKIYGCKTKTLYRYEYFGLDTYNEVISNQKIEDFYSSLSNSLPTLDDIDIFNNENGHQTVRDFTVVFKKIYT